MSPIFIVGLALSAVIGLSLGLIGGGGSILTVPILVYFLGVSPHEAITMSLAVVGATSLFGSFLHYRQANVDFRTGILFGTAGIVGAFLGSPLTRLVSPEALLMIFGILMFVVAIAMIWRRRYRLEEGGELPHYAKGLLAGLGVGEAPGERRLAP